MLQASSMKTCLYTAATAQQAAAGSGSKAGLVDLDTALNSGGSKFQNSEGLRVDDILESGVLVCNLSLTTVNHRVLIGHVPLPPHSTCRGSKTLNTTVRQHDDEYSCGPSPGPPRRHSFSIWRDTELVYVLISAEQQEVWQSSATALAKHGKEENMIDVM